MAYKGFVVCWLCEVSIVNSALLHSEEIAQCILSCIYYTVEGLTPLDCLLDASPSSWSL